MKDKEFQFTKSFTRRIKRKGRCLKRKCVKELKGLDKLRNITEKKVSLQCNKKPCDDYSECVDNHPDLLKLNLLEFAEKSSKLCRGPSKKCNEYYECTRKMHKKTGFTKVSSILSECVEKKCKEQMNTTT